MDTRLQIRLNQVARRIRTLHLGWSLAAIWAFAAICGSIMLAFGDRLLLPIDACWWWLGGSLALAAGFIIWNRRRLRNLPDVAQRIESHFPSLKQSLITAAAQRPGPNGRFGFLQRSVVSEAIRHDVRYSWKSLVPGFALTLGWLANIPAILAMVVVGFALWDRDPIVLNTLSSKLDRQPGFVEPIVEPGTTEVERGSSVIVTARFDGLLPDEVWLQHAVGDLEDPSVQADKIAMRQSLKDPIFAAYMYDIQAPLTYRVEYDQGVTQTYRIDVFEYPALVRADAILDYPVYTGMESKTIVDTRRVTMATGTKLTWQLHLNKPIQQGTLVQIDPESQLPLPGSAVTLETSPEDPQMLQAALTLTESTHWQLQLVDEQGRENSAEYLLRARVLPNRESQIQLTAGGDSQVSPLQEFTVAAKIKDDFAVQAAGIGYQFGGADPVEIEVALSESPEKEVQLSEIIDFESLEAEPSQLLSYYVWAEDEDSSGSRRRIMSDMFFAEVRPFEEIYREGDQSSQDQQQQQSQQQGQQQGNQQTEELLELQKQIVIGTWNLLRQAKTPELPGRLAPDLLVLAESQQQAIGLLDEKAQEADGVEGGEAILTSARANMSKAQERLEAAANDLLLPELTAALGREQRAYQDLLKLQSREFEVSRSRQPRSSQGQSQRSQSRQQQIDQLQLQNQENRYQDERQAQDSQAQQQSELRQAMSRLRELATRQEDLNKQLRELEAALQAAENEEEKEEIEQQLQRLREQQQQLLQDSDELQERLDTSENEALQDAQQQMEQARENIQQANESLRQGNTSQAISAGTRAESELKELEEEVRKQTANQFAESMQEMRSQASELEKRQQEIVEKLNEEQNQPSTGLRGNQDQSADVTDELQQQQEQLKDLLRDMEQTVLDAEDTEPLLAQKLYDSYRRANQEKVEERVDVTRRLLENNLEPQARLLAEESVTDMQQLREDIDDAAEAVLGSDVDALRLALDQLETLSNQLDSEISNARGETNETEQSPATQQGQQQQGQQQQGQQQQGQQQQGQQQQGQQQQGQQQQGQQQQGQQQQGQQQQGQQQQGQQQQGQQQQGQQQQGQQQQGQQQQGQQQQGQQQQGQQQQGQQQQGQQQQGQQQQGQQQQGQQQQGQQQQGQQQQGQQQQGQQEQDGQRQPQSPQQRLFGPRDSGSPTGGAASGGGNPRPLTGEEYLEWSDRLRDVEELVPDPELRWEATQIRQAAREIRRDVRKHAADPQWAEVEDLVARPLRQLKRKVSDELLRRAAEKTEIVPIDRDPVPPEFGRSVQEYYENLGIGLQ